MWIQRRFSILESIKGGIAMGGLLLMLGGAAIFGRQSYHWLKQGVWPPVSVLSAVERLKGPATFDRSWFVKPHSWFGLHRVFLPVLKWMPLSLLFFAAGLLIFGIFISLMDSWRRLNEPL